MNTAPATSRYALDRVQGVSLDRVYTVLQCEFFSDALAMALPTGAGRAEVQGYANGYRTASDILEQGEGWPSRFITRDDLKRLHDAAQVERQRWQQHGPHRNDNPHGYAALVIERIVWTLAVDLDNR
jgi:hypothetical protein